MGGSGCLLAARCLEKASTQPVHLRCKGLHDVLGAGQWLHAAGFAFSVTGMLAPPD